MWIYLKPLHYWLFFRIRQPLDNDSGPQIVFFLYKHFFCQSQSIHKHSSKVASSFDSASVSIPSPTFPQHGNVCFSIKVERTLAGKHVVSCIDFLLNNNQNLLYWSKWYIKSPYNTHIYHFCSINNSLPIKGQTKCRKTKKSLWNIKLGRTAIIC